MAVLTVINDRGYTEQFQLRGRECVLGRQADTDLRLDARDVSRRHARILTEGELFFVEDLGSSNGTFLNNTRVSGRQPLQEQDKIQIGPFTICFQQQDEPVEKEIRITASIPTMVSNSKLFRLDAARKLQVILEIAQQLSHTLDLKTLLPQLLERLLTLFLQADRGMVVLLDSRQRPEVRAIRTRYADQDIPRHFSRAVIKRVLDEGVGIVAEDASHDQRFNSTATLTSMGVRSFVCAPFKAHDGRPMGVVILDRFGNDNPFKEDDLHLLAATALLFSVVIENASLHEELVEKARMDRDLSLARQVQDGFLPRSLPEQFANELELYAEVYPAREVAGDYYDFIKVGPNRLGFAVADISGKGVSAAMLMSGIRTLCRHLLQQGATPADTLQQVNDMLAQDNPHSLFVTMVLGVLNTETGDLMISGGGHPPMLLRRADGKVERVHQPAGRLLGIVVGPQQFLNTSLNMGSKDTLLLYTDGLTETYDATRQNMFGLDRLMTALHTLPQNTSCESWERTIKASLETFSGKAENDDDLTIFLLRRK
ncbi:MAG: SpoIIE family protein phosphatase [Planctomycetia bacterium]|nr:SpoIIE family protein phosphatase [Planctomycetia bacterium]